MQFNRTHEGPPAASNGATTVQAAGARFLSVASAARLLGMSEVTLYRAIHGEGFPAIKIRGRYVIPTRALDAMEDAAVTSGCMVDAAAWVRSAVALVPGGRGSARSALARVDEIRS